MDNTPLETIKKVEIINISEEKECNYWTQRLGITLESLKSAIRATQCVTLKEISNYLEQHNIKRIVCK